MKRKSNSPPARLLGLASILALSTPAWADPLPISSPGGPYAVQSAGSISLDGSASAPSDTGTTITTYEWDLDGNDDFLDATGATPTAISYADLTTTWGMTSGPNTIKLRVTDDSSPTPLTETAEATVWINGTIYDGANGAWNNDSWNDVGPTPWDGGASSAPSGAGPLEVVIAAGKHPSVLVATPAYTGNLWVEAGAQMEIGQTNVASSLNALGTGKITFKSGSDLTLRYSVNSTHPQDFVLEGDMTFAIGRSTSAHHEQRTLTGSISGPGVMTLHDTNNQRLFLQGDNSSWTGGMVTGGSESESKNATIEADATNSLGSGPITIGDGNTLRIDANDATTGTPGTTVLTLNGNKSGNEAFKLYMNADDTVDQCFYQGVQLPAGSYTGGDFPWLSGTGTLTVATGSSETTAPTVTSWVNNVGGGPIYEDQVEVTYTVSFDEDISTTLTTAEFAVVGTGGASGTVSSVTKTSVALNPAVYTVVVQPSGTGTIQLQIPGTATIEDLNGNALVVPVSDPTVITINAGSTPVTPGNRYWDGAITSGTTNGASDGGTANWDNGTTTNWDRGPGLSAPVAWDNSSGDTAVFGGTTGTVTLDEDITLDGLTFEVVDAGGTGYFIGDAAEDNTLTFSGSKTITLNATGTNSNQDATIRAGIAGSPTLNIHGRANNSQFFALEPTANVTMTLGTLNMLNTFGSNKQLRLGGPGSGNVVDQITWTVTNQQLQVRKQDSSNGGADGSDWTINQDISLDDGRIYVDEGTLILGGTDNFMSHSVEVAAGGRIVLQGNWRIHDENEDFRVLSGGIVAPGGSVGTATFNWNSSRGNPSVGLVDLRTGSTYEWEVGAANATDIIALTEPVTNGEAELVVASGTTLKVIDAGGTPSPGDQLTVFTYDAGVVTPDTATLNANMTIDLTGTSWTGPGTFVNDGAGTIYVTGLSSGGGSPEIALEEPATVDIVSGVDSRDFGTVTIGSSSDLTFTVRNTGTADLNLTGTPEVDITGANAGDFSVTATPTTPVTSGGGTTTFTVQFSPTASGARAAQLSIANDDSDENPFLIDITGTGQTAYEEWAGGPLFDVDTNGDGIDNGMAWLLGAADPNADATGLLPGVSESGGDLVLTFNCLPVAARGGASLKVAYSATLAGWTPTTNVVPDATGADAGGVVSYVVSGPSGSPSVNSVTATIDSTAASGGKLFGRLEGTE